MSCSSKGWLCNLLFIMHLPHHWRAFPPSCQSPDYVLSEDGRQPHATARIVPTTSEVYIEVMRTSDSNAYTN